MARVTSKLQVTVPKAVADQFGIRPGSDITWTPAGDSIRVAVGRTAEAVAPPDDRLGLFDRATARQRARDRKTPRRVTAGPRGWTRESLYRDDRSG